MSAAARLRLLLGGGLLLLALGGCSFDVEIPEGAVVTCSRERGACPPGHFCQVSLGRCLPSSGGDREAPQLVSASLSASRLRRGAPLEVTLAVSEALSVPPAVTLLQGEGRWPLSLVEGAEAAPRFRFRWEGGDPVTEGTATVLVTLIDAAGNESAGLTAGVVTFDFTPPRVTELRYLAPRDVDADAGVVQVRPDEAMSVRLSLSEAVTDGGVLVQRAVDCGAPEVTWGLGANRDGVLDFFRGPSPVDTTCTWQLEARALTDLAGNEAPAVALEPTFHVNGVPPAIGQLALFRAAADGGLVPARAFSRQPGFSRLEAEFTAEASTRRLVASFDAEALATCTLAQACAPRGDGGLVCRCGRDVRSDDVEGTHVVAVQLTDGAGNQRTGTASLRFDFTPPALVPGTSRVLVAPRDGCPLSAAQHLGLGGTARVLFTLDEPAAQVPRVETSAPTSLAFSYESGAGTGFSFSHQLVSAAAQGALPVQLEVIDEAGNAAVLGGPDAGLAVTVDLDAPGALPVVAEDAVLFSRAPWGDASGRPRFEVLGAPGVVEPGVTVRVLPSADAGAGLELGAAVADADGGFTAALSNIDRTQVWVTAVDPACNEGPAAKVLDVRWVASLQGKVPGVAFPNPHTLEAWPDFQGEQARPDAVEPPDVALVGARDGVLAHSRARSQWAALDGTAPAARAFMTMAWDAARQRAVLFGGYWSSTRTREQDTWEFGPFAWSEVRAHGELPPGRNAQATGYDPLRRRVVMHGGFTINGQGDDLWEWDGATWTQRTGAGPRPSTRDSHAMGWDGNTGRLIIFGGAVTTPTGAALSDETWAWNGVRWEQVALTGPRPSPRFNHTLTWDPVRRRLLLFGGRTALGTYTASMNTDELWAFDGTSWAQVPKSGTWPTPRNAHHAAFDARRGVLVMFGGLISTATANETWEWDGAAWQQRTLPRVPSLRYGGDMVYDEGQQRVLLFGGFTSATVGETWHYDGTTWTQWSPASSRPAPRYAPALAWEPTGQRLVLFGGMTGTTTLTDFADTWTFADGGWTNLTDGGVAPPPRGYGGLGWDPQRARLVLHGGYRSTLARAHDDTWEWDGVSWSDGGLPDAGPSPGRTVGHQLVTDLERNTLLLTHGFSGSSSLRETWARVDGGWEQLDAGPGPSPRDRFAWSWDPVRREALLFGGVGPGNAYLSDTWALTAAGWVERAVPGPSSRGVAAMAWDGTSQRLVLYGGADTAFALDQTWEWDGQAWEQRAPGPHKVPALLGHGMAWDPVGQQVLLFAGRGNGNVDSAALWRYRVDPSGRPAWAARFQLSRAGLEAGDTVRAVTSRWVAGGSGAASSPSPAGLRLWAWDGTTLEEGPLSAAPEGAPAEVSWTTSDAARIARLQRGAAQELLFVLSPRGLNGDGRAVVALDYVEVEVRYRHP